MAYERSHEETTSDIVKGGMMAEKTQNTLWVDAANLIYEKRYDKAGNLLLQALKAEDDNPIDRHLHITN